jgi:uncharacterized protein
MKNGLLFVAGIARTFTFGGAKGRSLYDPALSPRVNLDKSSYMKSDDKNNTTLNHFYEKLFLLKDLMKTNTAKKMAQVRRKKERKKERKSGEGGMMFS